jgi:HIV Tat-specific factor 1
LDEELRKQQSAAYAVDGIDESEPVQPPKKRKKEITQVSGTHRKYISQWWLTRCPFPQADTSSKKTRKGSNDQQQHQRKNTSVYVTNIPRDATHDEVVELFSKYGILAESLDTGEKRVKLYTEDNGNFKGEALVTYFREESVPLAIQMLDDSDFRLGKQDPAGTIKVSKADFSHKVTQQDNSAPKVRSEKEKLKGRNKYMKMSRYGL